MATVTGIGARVKRVEDQRFITGKGRYTADMNRPGQAYAAFVRSPHAHARVGRIEPSAALEMPGVVAVLTGEHLAADQIGPLPCAWTVTSKNGSPMVAPGHPCLAQGKVRYVGDPVAVVIGETLAAARDGAEAVQVQYEELPAIVDLARAQAVDAPQVHDEAPRNTAFEWEFGGKAETEQAFSKARHVTRIDLVNNRLIPIALEPRAALGEYDPGTDSFTLHTTSQNPHTARLVISAFVNLAPEHKLRVVAPDVGGGFGSKIFIYPEEVVCAWASKKVSRPVKWSGDRSEAFLTDAHGRDHVTHAELATDERGRILGLKVKTVANVGGYMNLLASAVPTYLYGPLMSGQYNIPAIYVEVDAVYTTTAPVDALRGAGRPEAAFVVERLMEVAARELGVDPGTFRRRNLIRKFPHQTPVAFQYDTGDYQASLDRALELADYKGFGRRKREAARRGRLRGIGLSNYIEACGLAPSQVIGSLGAGFGLWESAEVRVNPVGTVEVLVGTHSHGQGHDTTFAQVVADRLGIPFESISIVHGDTDQVQAGNGTSGSRSAPVGLSAVSVALDKVIAKGKKIAAHLLEAAEGDVEFADGQFRVSGTDKSIDWVSVTLGAYMGHKFPTHEIEPGLKETAFYDPVNFAFPAGCHVCEVEIDPETGRTEIVNWVAVDDFGTIINPMIVEGQVHGGVAHGIGQALMEGAVYDGAGQLLSGSFMDYTMPRAEDLPSFQLDFTNTPCTTNPLGVKGCGEAGAIAAPPAVINAITDALGHEDIVMPATSQAVWHGVQKARMRAAAE